MYNVKYYINTQMFTRNGLQFKNTLCQNEYTECTRIHLRFLIIVKGFCATSKWYKILSINGFYALRLRFIEHILPSSQQGKPSVWAFSLVASGSCSALHRFLAEGNDIAKSFSHPCISNTAACLPAQTQQTIQCAAATSALFMCTFCARVVFRKTILINGNNF